MHLKNCLKDLMHKAADEEETSTPLEVVKENVNRSLGGSLANMGKKPDAKKPQKSAQAPVKRDLTRRGRKPILNIIKLNDNLSRVT